MKKVLIFGSYNHCNLGDDLMMKLINDFINSYDINCYYFKINNAMNCFLNNYNYVENPYFSIDYSKNRIKRYVESIRWNDIEKYNSIIFMGGGYTNEKFGIRNLLKMYILCNKFHRSNKKIYFTGQTIGPTYSLCGRFLLKRIYNLASYIGVREWFSEKYLEDNNLKGSLIGDDVFLAYNKIEGKNNGNYLIFNYKEFENYSIYKNSYFNFLLNVAKKTKMNIKIVPFRINKQSIEYKSNYELYEFLKKEGINADFVFINDVNCLYNLFRNCYGAIGTAYHCVTLALMFGKIAFGFYNGEYYYKKINGIFSWYGLEKNNCFDLSELNNNLDYYEEIVVNSFNNKQSNNISLISQQISEKKINEWKKIVNDIKNGGDSFGIIENKK